MEMDVTALKLVGTRGKLLRSNGLSMLDGR